MRRHDPDFPKAIVHIDGDSFFVSCELTRRPELKGRPCVTGMERGIATAANPEAKALGVIRGMRVSDIRRLYPGTVILESDYGLYRDIAGKMYEIVRRYADDVEEYSIDECFADLTGLDRPSHTTYEAMARAIQADLHRELGVTFGAGLGVNKVTAKIASKWRKPAGFTVIRRGDIPRFLEALPIGKVWGIGGRTTVSLRSLGIVTALDLARKDRAWVDERCDKPLREIWEEFQGACVKPVVGGSEQHGFASVQRTRTFWPATADPAFLWSQVSSHAEDACEKLRAGGRLARRASIMLKTRDFSYLRSEAELPDPTAAPEEVLRALRPRFEALFRPGLAYRASGISLHGLAVEEAMTGSLFAPPERLSKSRAVHAAADRLAARFGKGIVFLGSSWQAVKEGRKSGRPREKPSRGGIRFLE
ncbi:MAG: DNA polymerase IV [Patescibacteria group bacterium]|nr:DNA polymerase IV [Patescibacteria group bacterium]